VCGGTFEEVMAELAFIALLVTGPLAYVLGVDSRDGYQDRPRSWWPGSRR
jgi:hypothetical protein